MVVSGLASGAADDGASSLPKGERRTIPQQSWAYLDDEGYVTEALERPFDEEMVQYIIEMLDKLAAASLITRNRAKPEGRANKVPITVSMRPEEAERAAAFEEYLAYAANFDWNLHSFRYYSV